ETADLAVGSLGGEGWISGFNANTHGFLGSEQAAARQQAKGQATDEGEFLHVRSLAGCCWFCKTEGKVKTEALYCTYNSILDFYVLAVNRPSTLRPSFGREDELR